MVDLIRNQCIGSQEDLAARLAEHGYKVTQATLSRDLKMLKTTKVPTDRGTYMYILPDSNTLKDKLLSKGAADMSPNFQSGFISLRLSGNIAVIKTRNGYAAGLAYDIDMSNADSRHNPGQRHHPGSARRKRIARAGHGGVPQNVAD